VKNRLSRVFSLLRKPDPFLRHSHKERGICPLKALVNKGVALGRAEKPEEEIAVYDEVVRRFGDAEETPLLGQVAKALFNKGVALGQAEKPEEAIAVYDEVVRRFGDAEETPLLERVAGAFDNKASTILIMAKQVWQSPENENEAKKLLSRALADANALLEIESNDPIVLGNKGYTLFLLGREAEAEPILRKALEKGGEKIRDAELEDAKIHPLPQDESFEKLIIRLWEKVSAEKGDEGNGGSGDGGDDGDGGSGPEPG
jgi:tetratricopeptide (TPR) repeat protein